MLWERHSRKVRCALVGAALVALIPLATSAGENSTTLPNGANLLVRIDDPVTCTEFIVPYGETLIDVGILGFASIGLGEPDGTLVYVIDVSGSTIFLSAGGDCGGDVNGDGHSNTVLDCEAAAVLALNAAAVADGSIDEVGVAVYGESGAAGDMTPGGSDDPITAPNANGDVATVVQSLRSSDVVGSACVNAGLAQFTPKAVGCDGTNFAAGLAAAQTVVDASTNGTVVVIYLSDGLSNMGTTGQFNSNLTNLVETGAIIHSFAVGSSADCESGSYGTLQQMADASLAQNLAGSCTNVVTPAGLPDILPDLIGSTLESLALSVDGGPAIDIPHGDIPLDGAASLIYDTTAFGLGPADIDICVTATGSDVTGGAADVTQCENIHLLQLDYGAGMSQGDINDVNDLNFEVEHSVAVQIAGGTGPGRDVDFLVTGHNAGTTGSVALTPPDEVSFTYSVPQDCASLGSDTITATTLIAGEEDFIVFTKEWIDAVPPDVSCDPSVNPHGDVIPPAANTNPDGFYQLNAVDPNIANCTVTLQLVDGDGFVFPGPFFPGDNIKYTESKGAPQKQKKIGSSQGQAGAVKWHLKGHGDLTVFGTDPSGNVSSATCLVPPPPK